MPEDTASLQNLHDIVVPEPPPLWPPAPGAWVLAVVLLVIVAGLMVAWRRARARSAYRRAGLVLLEGARTNREINIVLKRVALACWPRPEVAPLWGEDWTAFLDRSCRRTRFSLLGDLDDLEGPSRDLQRVARIWIRRHRAPGGGSRGGV